MPIRYILVLQYHHLVQQVRFRQPLPLQLTWGLPLEGLVSPILIQLLLIWLRIINQLPLIHNLVI